MALYEEWKNRTEQERAPKEQETFWAEYFDKETEAYKHILSEKNCKLTGTVKELAERFSMDPQEAAGFLDGINTSLTEEVELDTLTEETSLELTIDFEKLYLNMLKAKAPWLYGLAEWDGLLSEEKRHEITKAFRVGNIYVAEKTVGRNDPCPCGSGKKYKKCCGANQ